MGMRLIAFMAIVSIILNLTACSFAQTAQEAGKPAASNGPAKETAVNVGNTICPVSGEKIEEAYKATYEYDGKIYNLCCAGCISDFKEDPQKYIAKVNEELSKS